MNEDEKSVKMSATITPKANSRQEFYDSKRFADMMLKLGLKALPDQEIVSGTGSFDGIITGNKKPKLKSLIPDDVSDNLWGELNQLAHDQLVEDNKKRKEEAMRKRKDLQ